MKFFILVIISLPLFSEPRGSAYDAWSDWIIDRQDHSKAAEEKTIADTSDENRSKESNPQENS